MLRQLRLLISLVRNDWRLFLADRRAAVMAFAVPIVLASVFGAIFDRPTQNVSATRLPLLIVQESSSPVADAVVKDLLASQRIEGKLVDRQEAERAVAARECGVAVIVPATYGTTSPPKVEVLHHPLSAMESQWAEGVISEVVARRSARTFLVPLGLSPDLADRPPVTIQRSETSGSASAKFNSYSHAFCGMTLQYLLFWGLESGLLYLRERQRGLWRRVRASPVPMSLALLSRALATATIALMQLVVTFAFGFVFFHVRFEGSWLGLASVALGASVLAAAIGLCVAAVGRTEARARSVFVVVILALAMLGGLWLPAFLLPAWARDLASALPTTWAMRGLSGATWQAQPFSQMVPAIAIVWIASIGLFLLAALRFRAIDASARRGIVR